MPLHTLGVCQLLRCSVLRCTYDNIKYSSSSRGPAYLFDSLIMPGKQIPGAWYVLRSRYHWSSTHEVDLSMIHE